MNLCRSCGEDFSSVTLFDAHRVGKHERLFSQGYRDGRRCLSADEMHERGWERNSRDLWHDPIRTSQAVTAFRAASQSLSGARP